MNLPQKLGRPPLLESVVELRFSTRLYSSAVFGVIYENLVENFPDVEKLPILQIPQQLLDSDPGLQYKTHFKISNSKNETIQIGPKTVLISAPMPYYGWDSFKVLILEVIEKIKETAVVERFERLGLRVINNFGDNQVHNLKLKLAFESGSLELKNSFIRTQIEREGFFQTIQIAEVAKNKMTGPKAGEVSGTMLDIDTYKEYDGNDFLQNYESEIENGHSLGKRLFFELISDDLLNSLVPIQKA